MRSDEKTFSNIVRTYQQPLYWYIRRVVVVHEDAEDILQETFAKAYRKLWTLRNDNALKFWLMRIATNEIKRYFRHRMPVAELPCRSCEPPDDSIDGLALQKIEEKLPSLIQKMSLLQREVFCMRYFEDMDYDSISRITGAGRNTLMVSFHQAKQLIKKELEQ